MFQEMPLPSRRRFLRDAGLGFGSLALASLLHGEAVAAAAKAPVNPLATKPPHFPAKVKSIIWLFMTGGPSQVDTWDYKPELQKRDGQALAGADPKTGFFTTSGKCLKSPFAWKQHGESGTWASDLFPHLSKHVDRMTFLHSMHLAQNNHAPAAIELMCGTNRPGLPSMGSWLTYGLGAENQDLPAFVVLHDTRPRGDDQIWSAGFLPKTYQALALDARRKEAIDNLVRDSRQSDAQQRAQLGLIQQLNAQHAAARPTQSDLAARIHSYELAYRMQMAAPEAMDIARETAATHKLYGLDLPRCGTFGRQCLIARRLVERGVRFVQIFAGKGTGGDGSVNDVPWDCHTNLETNHRSNGLHVDQPAAALLSDLASRGLLEETLVIWGGEFGRTSDSQGSKGRDHNPNGFTIWMAGAGVKPGFHYGATDEFGYKAVTNKVHVNDLHATLLHLLGLNHEQLTYRFNGRAFRLTDVGGQVIRDILCESEIPMTRKRWQGAAFVLVVLAAGFVRAEDKLTPGEFVIERPTLTCLGFRWYVDGDDNRNATAEVRYRAHGEQEERTALPLLRIKGETAFQTEEKSRWSAPNMFAGSILNLPPGKEISVRISLRDPDGGEAEKTVMVTTRSEPAAAKRGRELHVYPPGYTGAKKNGGYESLTAAYAKAERGDILLLHAGVYRIAKEAKRNRTDYIFEKQATAELPIVFRAAGDGEVTLDGDGALRLVDCQRSAHHGFEGITFRNADHGFYAGREAPSVGLFIKRCRFTECSYPIFALHPDCSDFYLADNTLEGPHPDWHPHNDKGNDSHAVWLQGHGHVVCYNDIHGFWDGIDLYGRVSPDDRAAHNCANDFYGNRISACTDDGIELDYGMHNVRAFDNLIYNTFMGISAQPVYAGPAYIVRNVVYNSTRSPLKPNQYPAGLLVFHNTFLAHGSAGTWAAIWQNSQIYNNLFVGSDDAGRIISTGTLTPQTSRLDYNGWRVFKTREAKPFFWKFTERTKVPTGSHLSMEGVFRDFAQFTQYTGYERHHVEIDYGDFVSAIAPSGANHPLPKLDLRLSPGSKAVDSGLRLANINDGFRGNGPDLGAYEQDAPLPHYGPRQVDGQD